MNFGLEFPQNSTKKENESVLSSLMSEDLPKELFDYIEARNEVKRAAAEFIYARNVLDTGNIRELGNLPQEKIEKIVRQREANYYAALETFKKVELIYKKSVQN